MADSDNNFQTSKKRAAGLQLSRDNPGLDDDEDTSEQEAGTFKRASDEVMASRRIVKVRRQQTPSIPSAAAPAFASNPFAAIRLVPTASPAEVEVHGATDKETEQTDTNDSNSENKDDKIEGEPNAANEKADINGNNDKISESEVCGSKAKINVEEDKTDEIREQNIIKSVVKEGTEGEKSGNGAKKSAEADHTDTETENNVQGKRNDGETKRDGEKSGNGVKKSAEADHTETETENNVQGKQNDGETNNNEVSDEKNPETSPFSSFQQLSRSQNAFSGLAGTGFSSTTFSFGSVPKDGSPGSSIGSPFGIKNEQPTSGFGVSSNGNSSVSGASGSSIISKNEASKFPSMQEVPLETGEENEKALFTADSVLFEFIDGVWKERGKGQLKINISTTGTGKARLIMRARGNYRLILNASLFPDMKLTNMDKKGISFACMNSAGERKDGLSTIALKFKDASLVEDFRAAVMEHKGKTAVAPKSSESPFKPSDD